MPIFDGGHQDAIAVVVIDDEDIAVTLTGSGGESAGDVHVGLASGCKDGSITIVCAFSIIGGFRKGVRIGYGVTRVTLRTGARLRSCGAEVLTLLVKMAFDGRSRQGWVPPKSVECKPSKFGDKASLEGFLQSGERRAKKRRVGKCHQIGW